jgi:hypothetical protein
MGVYKWIGKCVDLMQKYLEQIKLDVSDVWRTDELYVKIKGNNKYLFALSFVHLRNVITAASPLKTIATNCRFLHFSYDDILSPPLVNRADIFIIIFDVFYLNLSLMTWKACGVSQIMVEFMYQHYLVVI